MKNEEMHEIILSLIDVSKRYPNGLQALDGINLEVKRGEIFALLGENGAGKTTLISIICGIITPSSGRVLVDGNDIIANYRQARSIIGLVPQEVATDSFETVWNTVTYSRGLYGKPADPFLIEKILKDLSLWDRRDSKIMSLSGGMKRRLMIAKALSHEPSILFLDEPSAGVDVGLRKGMWNLIRDLQCRGVTIILTTHYIEEAEEMADRIGIIQKGKIILVDDKEALINNMGKKELVLELQNPLITIPDALQIDGLTISKDGYELTYTFDSNNEQVGIVQLLSKIAEHGIVFKDLHTKQSSLEEIFVSLINS